MDKHSYYMTIAMAVRKKANCLGRRVGAVIVRDDRIVSTGYNGTPEGIKNCRDGGCVRCKDRETYQASVGYDVCICVHADANVISNTSLIGLSILATNTASVTAILDALGSTVVSGGDDSIITNDNGPYPSP